MKKAFCYQAPILPLNFCCLLLMLAAFGLRVFRAMMVQRDFTVYDVIFFFCLPLMASLIYAVLLFKTRMAVLTVLPFSMMTVSYILYFVREELLLLIVGCALTLLCWLGYELTLRGRISFQLPLSFLLLAVLFLHLYALSYQGLGTAHTMELISLSCYWAGVCLYVFSLKKVVLQKPFRRIGDRNDGRLLRSRPPMDKVAPYIMVSKLGAANLFRDEFEIAKAEKYILQKRKEGLKGFGLMHILVAAYVRTISQKPAINRFVSGQKVYARDELIEINMVVKKEMKEDAPETVVKFTFSPAMTARQVYDIIQSEVLKNKTQTLDADMDHTAALLNYIPGPVLKFLVWLLKLLDYFGLLPRFLTKVSPFHGSLFITSMGSLGIPPVQHHLYDFGNLPCFLSFGTKKKRNILNSDGSITEQRYCEFTVNIDDRICDGYTYAQAFKVMKRYVANPYLLDEPPEKVVRDIE